MLLQAADFIQRDGKRLLYVSGEESESQIKMRGDRLGIHPSHLFLLTETCLERISKVWTNCSLK